METIRTHIPDKLWEALPEVAKTLISEKDYSTRMSGHLKDIKPKVRKELDAGETITISAVAEREALRLRKSGKITGDEFPRVKAYFANQISGAVSAAKEKATGQRVYLPLGKGRFAHREYAPESAWAQHAKTLMADSVAADKTVEAWLALQMKKFGRLPPDLASAVTREVNKTSEAKPTRSRKRPPDAPDLHA